MPDISHSILALHGWAVIVAVFALPALEASIFLGFVFPGEIAVVLGGVLAFEHRANLAAVLAAAIAGAVVGDTIGYAVGRRFGERVLASSVGRFVKPVHVDRAKRYLAERGGRAVFLGRFAAALRALVPGLAGMSGVPYGRFVVFNIAGGTVWATIFVLLGYGAGDSWRHVASLAGQAGYGLAAVVALGVLATALVRRRGRQLAAARVRDQP
jgi:membrane protein DedA with SNARE-associated domain